MSEIMSKETLETLKNKYLTFYLDKRLFGLPLNEVIEIVQMDKITPVPEFPYYAKGVMLNKGKVVPIMDLRLRFGFDEIEYTDTTCVILVNVSGTSIGFIVDSVSDLADIDEAKLSAPPSITSQKLDNFILNTAEYKNNIVIILDGLKILDQEDLDLVLENTK